MEHASFYHKMASWSNVTIFSVTFLMILARITQDRSVISIKFTRNHEEESSVIISSCKIGGVTAFRASLRNLPVLSPTITTRNLNFLTMFLILLCGDIESDPGPRSSYTPKYPCTACSKGITSRSKAISCDLCEQWTHIKCSETITLAAYNEAVNCDLELNFVCDKCQLMQLPSPDIFNDPATDSDPCTTEDDSIAINETEDTLQLDETFLPFRKKGLHFIHINARSLRRKIPEINILTQKTNASIVAVTETWLDGSVTDSEIGIDGYTIQ